MTTARTHKSGDDQPTGRADSAASMAPHRSTSPVVTPARPTAAAAKAACKYTPTGSQGVNAGATVDVTWQTEVYNDGGGFTLGGDALTFTVASALDGKVVAITAQVQINGDGDVCMPAVEARINGTISNPGRSSLPGIAQAVTQDLGSTAGHQHEMEDFDLCIQVKWEGKVSSGDTFHVDIFQSNGDAEAFSTTAAGCWITAREV